MEVSTQLSLIREESERHDTDQLLSLPPQDQFNQDDILQQLLQTNFVNNHNLPSDIADKDENLNNIEECDGKSNHNNGEKENSPIMIRAKRPLSQNSPVSIRVKRPSSQNSPVMVRVKRASSLSSRRSLNSSVHSLKPERRRTSSANSSLIVRNWSFKKRMSMPTIIPKRKISECSTHSGDSSGMDRASMEIFDQLDKLDGEKNGMISKAHLKKWISSSAQELNSFSLTEKYIPGNQLARLLSEYDENKDGYIDVQEFEKLVQNQENNPRPEVAKLLQSLKTAAFAEVYKLWPPPIFLLLVSLFQVILFCIHAHHLRVQHGLEITWNEPAPQCSMLIYNPYRRREAWRYLSYALVHSGMGHIGLNLVIQLFVGLPLEMSHGSLRIGIVYMCGVVGGSLATSSFDPNMYLVGASGGVYSLIAAHLASLTLNWKEDVVVIRQRFRQGKLRLAKSSTLFRLMRLLSVIIYAVCDTGFAIYARFMYGTGNTGYLAHLAGAIAGLCVGLIVLKNRKKENWEVYIRVMCAMFCGTTLVLSIVWNVEGDTIYQKYYKTNTTYFLPADLRQIHNCTYYGHR